MSRFSPQVSLPTPQALDFSSIGEAFSDIGARRQRNRQLGLAEREQDTRDQEAARTQDDYMRRVNQSSRPFDPIQDVAGLPSALDRITADASRGSGGLTPMPQAMPQAMPQTASTFSQVGIPAGTPPDGIPRNQRGVLLPGPTSIGAAPQLAAEVNAARTQPGERPTDFLASLRQTMPTYTSMVGGELRVFDPAREAVNTAATQSLPARLARVYQTQDAQQFGGLAPDEAAESVYGSSTQKQLRLKREEAMQKARPFLSQTNPQTGKPFTQEEALAIVENPAFAQHTFRPTRDERLADQKELAAFTAGLRPRDEPLMLVQDPENPDGPGIYVPRSQAAGKAGARKTPTDKQNHAAGLLSELESAATQLETLGSQQALSKMADKAGWFGNYAKTDDGQVYDQLADQFANNLTYLKSGRAATNQERETLRKTYVAVPGDAPAVVERKRVARTEALAAARKEAGRAAPTGGSGTATATPAQMQRAAGDPAYKQFLIEKGVRF